MAGHIRMPRRAAVAIAGVAITAVAIAGCSTSSADQADAKVAAKEKAVAQAEADFTAASGEFCQASKTYIDALDRYGDVLTDTAPTVGDVRQAGADLAAPKEDAFEGAEAAVDAQQALFVARQELAEAQAEQAAAASPSASPVAATPVPTPTPLAPAESVDRVKQAESEFTAAQASITDETPLAKAAEQFSSAAVALELSWLQLFLDTGCVTDEQKLQAQTAVSDYTKALQQDLADAKYYEGKIDGIYGPQTAQAVEDLQKAHGLPVTGTVDRATAAALAAEIGKESVASTAALQQTLKLVGFWDGPVDGTWTDELTDSLKAFQAELGVEPTGEVDAATVTAFEKAVADLTAPDSSPAPSPSASATP